MKILFNILSIFTYGLLMFIGLSFLIGFLILGIFIAVEFNKIMEVLVDFINTTAKTGQSWIDWVINFLDSIGVHIQFDGTDWVLGDVPGWAGFVVAIPCFIFALLGLAIMVLTQRSTGQRHSIKKLERKVKELEKGNS